MKIILTGISGKAGRLVAMEAARQGHEVIGIDKRGWADAPQGIRVERVDIRKRGAEDVFRREQPDAVIHMATVTHLTRHQSEERYRINLAGTRAVFDHSHNYGVGKVLFIGRHTFYGAGPETCLYHKEDSPPRSVNLFPELADLVAADLYAGSALWRYPELETSILRFCYTLGPANHGTLASFLRGPRVPTVLGFDPLFQFLHESDMAKAIVLALTCDLRGVYNVAGPAPIPLSVLIRETGRKQMVVPEPLFRLATGRFGLPYLPKGAVDHIKYPVIMDASAFKEATGFQHEFDSDVTMEGFRDANPVPR